MLIKTRSTNSLIVTKHASQLGTEAAVIGSRIAVRKEELIRFVNWHKMSAESAIANDDLIFAHNAYVLYTYVYIYLCSSHRDVVDPHHDLDGFCSDSGLALICDKVADSSHGYRVATLPVSVFDQLHRYIHHLEALSVRLPTQHRKLATEILAATIQNGKRPIPLFFFLSDDFQIVNIRPKELGQRLGNSWKLPVNTNRHTLAEFLSEQNCMPEHIEAQLGHIESGCHPFGPYSSFSPAAMANNLRAPLEEYVQSIGLQPIDGFKLYRNRGLPAIRAGLASVVSDNVFGPDLRAEKRHNTWLKDSEFVRAMIDEALEEAATEILPDKIEQMIQRLTDYTKISDKRFIIRYELLRRHLREKRRKGIKLILPGRLALAHSDPSPFQADTFLLAARTKHLRHEFTTELDQRGKTTSEFTPERRIAEILISAILNSSLLFNKAIENLPTSLISEIYHHNTDVWIDIILEPSIDNSPIRRWFPDRISTALLVGWNQYLRINQTLQINKNLLIDEIILLLEIIGLSVSKKKKSKKALSLWNTLKPLVEIARGFWVIELPQVLYAYANGTHLAPSLPPNSWARLLTGRRLSQTSFTNKPPSWNNDNILRLVARQTKSPSHKEGRNFWAKLRKIINVDADDKGNKNRTRVKKYIEKNVLALIRENNNQVPNIALCIAGWAIHICRHGSPFKADLAKKTIRDYIGSISELLIENAHNNDFLALGEVGYTDIYCKVVAASSRVNKTFTPRCLFVFHQYLTSSFQIENPDWGEIYPDNCKVLFPVDAGFISWEEYINTLNHITGESEFVNPTLLASAMYLIIAYRFGPRPGELNRLRLQDIQIFSEMLFILIRNTKEGETKTENGVRQIPLCEVLSPREKKIVHLWLAHLKAKDTSIDTPIFSNEVLDTILWESPGKIVIDALRSVTGDQNVRLRHLRHSYASRMAASLIADPTDNLSDLTILNKIYSHTPPEHVRMVLLGRPDLSRRSLYALTTGLGHGGPAVSLNNYIHLLDRSLYQAISTYSTKISDHALSYSYAIKNSYLRVLRNRQKENDSYIFDTLIHRLPAINIEFSTDQAPPLQLDVIKNTQILSFTDIDRILFSVSRRSGDLHGVSEAFFTTDNIVKMIVKIASELQILTGYTEFRLPHNLIHPTLQTNWPESGFEKETLRARKELNRLDDLRNNLPETFMPNGSCLADIWKNSYEHNSLLFI